VWCNHAKAPGFSSFAALGAVPLSASSKLTATMTATTATSRDHRRALATAHALVMPQDLVNCHT
jgi:hypothetical protein